MSKESNEKELQPFEFEEYDHEDDYSGGDLASSDNQLEIELPSRDTNNVVDLDLDTSKNGWSAEEMLNTNMAKYGYKSTYKSDLTDYT